MKDGVLDSKESPSAPRGGKRGHPEVTITTGAKKDGHRVKVRGATKRHSRVQGSAHDSKESDAAQRGGKRVPQMKGTTSAGVSLPIAVVCMAVHTARKSHQPHKVAVRGVTPKSRSPQVPKKMATV